MRLVFLFSFLALIATPLSLCAQRVTKVKRKGVKIINVTKPSTNTSLYSLKQLTGKWQEISRKDRENNSAVDFTDTLLFNFYGDDNVSVRNGINLSVQGSADIQPGNILTAAGDEFIIKSLDKTKAVLDDEDKYIHTMLKTKSFWYETLPTDSIVTENFITPVAVSLSDVAGKWAVYRRNARPGATGRDLALIKKITIEDKDDNTLNGEITFYQAEKTETLSCLITVDANKIKIVTAKHSWQMDVYKVNKEEFIFGSPALMYYAKRY